MLKPIIKISTIFLFVFAQINFSQDFLSLDSLKKISKTHDLTLPDWGPYTKRYIGISHIPDVKSGLRFDLSVFPGLYRRKISVPNVHYESDYHPWEASPNLEYFSFRHEVIWKDQLYTDISYSNISEKSRLIKIECVNNTEQNENLVIHFMASMNFPPIKEYSPYTPIYPMRITLPNGAQWIDAIDYSDLKFANARPSDNLVYDGKMRGEIRVDKFVNGSGIGTGFGKDIGDEISFNISLQNDMENAVLMFRYKMKNNSRLSFNVAGLIKSEILFTGNDDFSESTLELGKTKKGNYELKLISNGGSEIELDGFAIVEKDQTKNIKYDLKIWNYTPQITEGPVNNSLILKYEDVDKYYGLIWFYDEFEIREWYGRDLADYFKRNVNEHNQKVFHGEEDGHFTNVFLRPIIMEPNSKRNIYGVVYYGTKNEIEDYFENLKYSPEKFEEIYSGAKRNVPNIECTPDGEKYKFSIEKMNATLDCNVVYPIYTQKQYIRHHAPGRWWDCLYTWDSGFIGMGLLQSDVLRAAENLNAYTQEVGEQSAFIHHGTPVPTQHYLFLELWNKTQSKDMLEYFYPRLKQYHEFMAGKLGSSSTKILKSNLLKTWDYFYNSGGWDDLPPQKYVRDNGLEKTLSPVITSSQVIRTAKILKMTAEKLGYKNDVKEFDNDIETFSKALQKYSWDNETGYFGYVVHNENGNPDHILKYNNEINYDMTFDGAYPLIAGICNDSQKERILSSLKSDKHIWSNVGLSAVDQSAPYYKIDGYWNGTVWMAHQWFFWKTMLDLGESEFAFKIAKTALDVWKNEVETSYNCMEHFLIETGRGAGWHEFGALSSPVVIWFAAYYQPGNFSAGFDVWIENKKFDKLFTNFSADISVIKNNNRTASFVVCMNPNFNYEVKWNNKVIDYKMLGKGTLSIDLNLSKNRKGKLDIVQKPF